MNINEQTNNIRRTIIITLVLIAIVVGLVWMNITHGDTTASAKDVPAETARGISTAQPY